MHPDIEARFWSKIDRSGGPDACWPFMGARLKPPNLPYGMFRLPGETVRANRLALILSGVDLGDRQALHTCDNPPCCNPKHLYPGTNEDNVKDRKSRNRCTRLGGWEHPNTTLTQSDVEFIRLNYGKPYKQQELAERFGVRQSTISNIIHGKTWASIRREPDVRELTESGEFAASQGTA